MSVFYRLVLNSVCRSNHHRLAILALEHLKDTDAHIWRNLFLKHHATYLEGAKAPDAEFKDFKNHVCHVEDGYWGGAPQSAAEWYRRTVRALKAHDWKEAAWAAGVMSHYVVDPVQPFHTGQTEEEGVIHRALEWSLTKAYPELKLIIDQDLGWPEVAVPQGDDWVADMVRTGARISHAHYHTLIDHYDFKTGAKNPVAGLDQELKDVAAALMAYASVMLARILDRAFDESGAIPQEVPLALDTLFATCAIPVRTLMKGIENEQERELVAAQYAEFQRTGKVVKTLSDDDKLIRELHAAEVTQTNLSSLDCQWPRETGTAHGAGAPARKTKKAKPEKPAKVEKAKAEPKPAKARKPGPISVDAEDPIAVMEDEGQHHAAIDTEEAEVDTLVAGEELDFEATPQAEEPAHADPEEVEAAAPPAEPVAETDEQPDAGPDTAHRPRIRLTREAPVVDAPSIGPKTAGRLKLIGVNTVADLLALAPEDAAKRIKASHINARVVRDWQAQALLACTIPDINGTSAQLLVGAGVHSPDDLAASDPAELTQLVEQYADTEEAQRLLRGNPPPDEDRISQWIEAAQGQARAA